MAENGEEAGRLKPAPELAPETPAPALVDKTPVRGSDAVVDQWLAEYFPDSTITRDSAGWQHVFTAAAELKRRLKGA